MPFFFKKKTDKPNTRRFRAACSELLTRPEQRTQISDFLVVVVCPDHPWANHHNPSWANHQRGVARVLQEQGPDGTPCQVLRLLHRESRVLRQLDRELLTWSHKTGVGASHCNLLRNFTMNNFPRSRVLFCIEWRNAPRQHEMSTSIEFRVRLAV